MRTSGRVQGGFKEGYDVLGTKTHPNYPNAPTVEMDTIRRPRGRKMRAIGARHRPAGPTGRPDPYGPRWASAFGPSHILLRGDRNYLRSVENNFKYFNSLLNQGKEGVEIN
jgi:hypothetical protein